MKLSAHYGSEIILRNCILGKNLNLLQIRGFGGIEMLSDISKPDVYDQVDNPLGTQRDLQAKHAKDASEYAFSSVIADPDTDPRSFPEVIFNVRNTEAITVFANGNPLDMTMLDDLTDVLNVELKINVNFIEEISEEADEIPISRVDGNHRLSRVPPLDAREDLIFPNVSFALFMGLTLDQERKLFSDINGTQKVMNTAHLAQIAMRAGGERLLLDAKNRPLWVAQELTSNNKVFHNYVYNGGSKVGIKSEIGTTPPVTLTQLRAALSKTINGMPKITNQLFPSGLIERARDHNDPNAMKQLKDNAKVLEELIGHFWQAVAFEFPEAWQDGTKKQYILFNSIGLDAFSRIGAQLISELWENQTLDQSDFNRAIHQIRNGGVTLEKSDFHGFAGSTGANKVYETLMDARQEGSSSLEAIKEILFPKGQSKLEQ